MRLLAIVFGRGCPALGAELGEADALVAGAAPSGAPPSTVSGGVQPLVMKRTLPKRVALWKLPWPRMGDQATPELFCIA